MSTRVPVQPDVLQWASERSAITPDALRKRFPRYDQWETGEAKPTLKQLQDFAKATHTPFGYLLLAKPPKLGVPIPDFRTMGSKRLGEPSPNLLDTVYTCQQRQEWYGDYARSINKTPLKFIASTNLNADITATAAKIRKQLNFGLAEQRASSNMEQTLARFRQQAEELGILVMVNGVVGSNTHRKLDPGEFRGFALADKLAPLVFINGADTKAGQMFTLAHELAHLWLGETGLSDATALTGSTRPVERWCNKVAAELLVPLEMLRDAHDSDRDLFEEMNRLARRFKVSTLVILRRIRDTGRINRARFEAAYDAELTRLKAIIAKNRKSGGGDFYRTTPVRVSERFARAVVSSSFEGRSTFTEAMRLVGCRKMSTFRELGHHLGVVG